MKNDLISLHETVWKMLKVAERVRKMGVDEGFDRNNIEPDRKSYRSGSCMYSVWVRKIEQKESNRETVKRVVRKT